MTEILNRFRSGIEDLISDRKKVIRIMSVVFVLLLAGILRIHETAKSDVTIVEEKPEPPAAEFYVDIGGEVNSPGVYKVTEDTRLYEVIEMADGLTDEADTDSINQASFVDDGQKIIIPRAGEADDVNRAADGTADTAGTDSTSYAHPSDSLSAASGLININTASAEELSTLNGIGDALAERIIEHRRTNVFRSKEDIMSVKGIGEAKYNKIKDRITV